MTEADDIMPETNCQKYNSDRHLEIPKDIAIKREETHITPSCNISRRSAPDICPQAKKTFFLIMDSPGCYRPMI